MLKWIIVISLLISAAIAGFFYLEIEKNGGQLPEPPARNVAAEKGAIHIDHAFKDGVHKFTGKVRLPHSCYLVTPEIIVDQNDPSKFLLTLKTEDHMADLKICTQFPTSYEFQTIAEGKEGITLTLKVNNKDYPVDISEVPWQQGNEIDRHR